MAFDAKYLFLNALFSGIAGAMASHIAYVQSNLFILGDVTRRGRHALYDPAFFDVLGLVWGGVVGAACVMWCGAASPGTALIISFAVTVLGVGAVGGASVLSRYRALPREPLFAGQSFTLEFALRLPASRRGFADLPRRGALNPADTSSSAVLLLREHLRTNEGRLILVGRLRMLQALSPRLLVIDDHDGSRVNFWLPLAAVPTAADMAWSGWLPAANAAPGPAPSAVFDIRYRVWIQPAG